MTVLPVYMCIYVLNVCSGWRSQKCVLDSFGSFFITDRHRTIHIWDYSVFFQCV